MDHNVFISYSSHDQATASAVCAALEAADIRCWIASRDIVPGTEWEDAIVEAIDQCPVMVLIFSPFANNSRQVLREMRLALEHGTTILPFRIADIPPSKAMSYYLVGIQWLDALPPSTEQSTTRLLGIIQQILLRSQTLVTSPPAGSGSSAVGEAKSAGNTIRTPFFEEGAEKQSVPPTRLQADVRETSTPPVRSVRSTMTARFQSLSNVNWLVFWYGWVYLLDHRRWKSSFLLFVLDCFSINFMLLEGNAYAFILLTVIGVFVRYVMAKLYVSNTESSRKGTNAVSDNSISDAQWKSPLFLLAALLIWFVCTLTFVYLLLLLYSYCRSRIGQNKATKP